MILSANDWQTFMLLAPLFVHQHYKPRTEPNENEYMGNDGLLHCKKCKAPVQDRLYTEVWTYIVPCKCKCEKDGGL